jgi:ubiquinone/menaquinone biosynthesis C-methylase UbiE
MGTKTKGPEQVKSPFPNKNTEREKRCYNRFAGAYDFIERRGALRMNQWRTLLWSTVEGSEVLEVGVGTGANFPYYPQGVHVHAIDLSTRMLERAWKKAGRDSLTVNLEEMDVQSLRFPDETFDTVVASLVFCAVPDPNLGLREVKRVCKPGGKVSMLEHVRGPGRFFGFMTDLFNPLMLWTIGDNINRRTVENVAESGLKVEKVTNLGSIWRLIEARKA